MHNTLVEYRIKCSLAAVFCLIVKCFSNREIVTNHMANFLEFGMFSWE